MKPDDDRPATFLSPLRHVLPPHERVLDGLSDLVAAEEALGILHHSDIQIRFAWLEPRVRRLYDAVAGMMEELCD